MITRPQATCVAAYLGVTPAFEKIVEYSYLVHVFDNEIISGTSTCLGNRKFQVLFVDFFAMKKGYGPVGGPILNRFFELFDDLVTNSAHRSMSYVLPKLNVLRNTVEVSYASKMLHMFDRHTPIWDQYVVAYFKHPHYGGVSTYCRPGLTLSQRTPIVESHYCVYSNAFNEFASGRKVPLPGEVSGPDIVSIFRASVPSAPIPLAHSGGNMSISITDEKAIDFILWQARYLVPGPTGYTIRAARLPHTIYGEPKRILFGEFPTIFNY